MIERRDPLTQAQGVEQGYAQTARRWPSQPLARRPHGAAELSGPRDIAHKLPPVKGDLAGYGAKRALGQLVRLRIRVLDEDRSEERRVGKEYSTRWSQWHEQ